VISSVPPNEKQKRFADMGDIIEFEGESKHEQNSIFNEGKAIPLPEWLFLFALSLQPFLSLHV
jgi:hypothetical protein